MSQTYSPHSGKKDLPTYIAFISISRSISNYSRPIHIMYEQSLIFTRVDINHLSTRIRNKGMRAFQTVLFISHLFVLNASRNDFILSGAETLQRGIWKKLTENPIISYAYFLNSPIGYGLSRIVVLLCYNVDFRVGMLARRQRKCAHNEGEVKSQAETLHARARTCMNMFRLAQACIHSMVVGNNDSKRTMLCLILWRSGRSEGWCWRG